MVIALYDDSLTLGGGGTCVEDLIFKNIIMSYSIDKKILDLIRR